MLTLPTWSRSHVPLPAQIEKFCAESGWSPATSACDSSSWLAFCTAEVRLSLEMPEPAFEPCRLFCGA